MSPPGLIVGLGNPGAKYEGTRHNFGFMVLDGLAAECQSCKTVKTVKGKLELRLCDLGPGSGPWLLLKPLTYMNLSGDPVSAVSRYYGVDPAAILVVHDELDLPLGRMRIKFGGGLAGHNGLKSIAERLGTNDFHRLRLGIGKPGERDGAAHVLSRFTEQEKGVAQEVAKAAAEGILVFTSRGLEQAARLINPFTAEPDTVD